VEVQLVPGTRYWFLVKRELNWDVFCWH